MFSIDKFEYVSNMLTREECDDITELMFEEQIKGNTKADIDSKYCLYKSEIFKPYIERIRRRVEEVTGLSLTYTYHYSRIYTAGDTLPRHCDRKECEVSITMTLGYGENDSIWPIYMTDTETDPIGDEFLIEIGDSVVYRGHDLWHWREDYKGEWQTQVFVHFVDKNGPYSDTKEEFIL